MTITIPSLALGCIIAILIGALFHLFLGGGFFRLFFYLFLSLIGFAAGQLIGGWRNWILFPIGALNLGMGIIVSLIFLVAGYWVSLVRHSPNDKDDAV